jgi:hypothetical protein
VGLGLELDAVREWSEERDDRWGPCAVRERERGKADWWVRAVSVESKVGRAGLAGGLSMLGRAGPAVD